MTGRDPDCCIRFDRDRRRSRRSNTRDNAVISTPASTITRHDSSTTISIGPLAGVALFALEAGPAYHRRPKAGSCSFSLPESQTIVAKSTTASARLMSPHCRSDGARCLQTLQNDLEFLIIGPAAAPASLNNFEPSTALVVVDKGYYTTAGLSRQDGRHWRESPSRPHQFSHSSGPRPVYSR